MKIKKISFGSSDYWRMFLKRGFRLPIYYFLNAHLFDLINKTDTHIWHPKEEFTNAPLNFEHGVLYMPSWTSEIKNSFNQIMRIINNLHEFSFVDIGCGKGKVILTWKKLLKIKKINQRVIGLDYYEPFILISKNNHDLVFAEAGDFLLADAIKVNYADFGEKLIVYLYNPFNRKMFLRFVNKLKNKNIFLIYNNPIHHDILIHHGFSLLYQKKGFHPNCHTMIFNKTND